MLGIRLAVAHALENHWRVCLDVLEASLRPDEYMLNRLVGNSPLVAVRRPLMAVGTA
jgi:hypothetical protein